MYAIFALDENGTLWQLDSGGWSRNRYTSFVDIEEAREIIYTTVIPAVEGLVDSFIGEITMDGTIIQTFVLFDMDHKR